MLAATLTPGGRDSQPFRAQLSGDDIKASDALFAACDLSYQDGMQ